MYSVFSMFSVEGSQQLPSEIRWLYEVGVLLAGLCVGSFLNVVIARVPEGLSLIHPGSRCPKCETPIRWYDNVPVLGWLFLRGRCRACGSSISIRYPLVELLVGLLALALARRYGLDARVLIYFTFCCLLVAISYIDLDHWIIPHALSQPGIVLGLIASAFNPDVTFAESAIGFAAGFGVFALIGIIGAKVFKKEALGQGDWWLLGLIGAFLGWQALLPVILLASLQGTVVGLLLIVLGRGEPGEEEAEEDSEESDATESAASRSPPSESPASESTVTESIVAGAASGEAPERAGAATGAGAGEGAPAVDSAEANAEANDEENGEVAEGGASRDNRDDRDDGDGEDDEWEEEDWVPPANAIPFGPFLALAGLQYLFFGHWLVSVFGKLFAGLTL